MTSYIGNSSRFSRSKCPVTFSDLGFFSSTSQRPSCSPVAGSSVAAPRTGQRAERLKRPNTRHAPSSAAVPTGFEQRVSRSGCWPVLGPRFAKSSALPPCGLAAARALLPASAYRGAVLCGSAAIHVLRTHHDVRSMGSGQRKGWACDRVGTGDVLEGCCHAREDLVPGLGLGRAYLPHGGPGHRTEDEIATLEESIGVRAPVELRVPERRECCRSADHAAPG